MARATSYKTSLDNLEKTKAAEVKLQQEQEAPECMAPFFAPACTARAPTVSQQVCIPGFGRR